MLLIDQVRRMKQLRNQLATIGASDCDRKAWRDELVEFQKSLPPSIPSQLKRIEHSLGWALSHTKELEVVLDNLELDRGDAMRKAIDGITNEIENALCILKGGDS